MNLAQKLEDIRIEIADRRYYKRVFRESMKAMSFPYKLRAMQLLRYLAKESEAEDAAARAPKEEPLPAGAWKEPPSLAQFPNLYAEIALRVCGEPEEYAKAAGVTVRRLYNVVYGGCENFTEQEKEALMLWVGNRSDGVITPDYLFAPSFSVYYTANRKHRHKLEILSAKFKRVKALAEEFDKERAEIMARLFGEALENGGFMLYCWASRAWCNKTLLYLKNESVVLRVKAAMAYAADEI